MHTHTHTNTHLKNIKNIKRKHHRPIASIYGKCDRRFHIKYLNFEFLCTMTLRVREGLEDNQI